jgi:hypothetical protein
LEDARGAQSHQEAIGVVNGVDGGLELALFRHSRRWPEKGEIEIDVAPSSPSRFLPPEGSTASGASNELLHGLRGALNRRRHGVRRRQKLMQCGRKRERERIRMVWDEQRLHGGSPRGFIRRGKHCGCDTARTMVGRWQCLVSSSGRRSFSSGYART